MLTRKKIIHFLFSPVPGGPHTFVEEVRKLPLENIVHYRGIYKKNKSYDFSLFLWRKNSLTFLIEQLIVFFQILYIARSLKIRKHEDIFHVHSLPNIAPVLAGLFLNVKVILTIHENMIRYQRMLSLYQLIVRLFPRRSFRISYVSHEGKRTYKLSDNSIYTPAFVDTDFWKRTHFSPRLPSWDT